MSVTTVFYTDTHNRSLLDALPNSALRWLAAQPASGSGQTTAGWSHVSGPATGAAEAIGKYNAGCLAGGVALPQVGHGFQLTEIHRNRRFAHPDLAAYLLEFGERVRSAGLGDLTIEDVAQPRGGPMPSGHRSHQMGLDADIWYRLDAPPSAVDADQWKMVRSEEHTSELQSLMRNSYAVF